MPQINKILIIVLTVGVLICNSNWQQINASSRRGNVMQAAFAKNQIDCTRAEPEPIVKKSVFPKTKFQLRKDKITGIETVDLANGDKLIITNSGCEYYSLTFRFETVRFQEATTNLQFWFGKAALLMSEIDRGIKSPIDIKNGTTALVKHINKNSRNNRNLTLGEEIDFGGQDIRDFVTVDRIEKLAGKKYAVEISFVTGPL